MGPDGSSEQCMRDKIPEGVYRVAWGIVPTSGRVQYTPAKRAAKGDFIPVYPPLRRHDWSVERV